MPPSTLRRVIVGIDGSPHSIAALQRAAREARGQGAELEVIHVVTQPDRLGEGAVLMDTLTDGIPVTRKVVVAGSSGRVLCDHSAGADLLVLGAKFGEGPLDGTTLSTVLRFARCQILICATKDIPGRMSWSVRMPVPR